MAHVAAGETAQLCVNERKQAVEGRRLTAAPRLE
jgi:hypothetical protein